MTDRYVYVEDRRQLGELLRGAAGGMLPRAQKALEGGERDSLERDIKRLTPVDTGLLRSSDVVAVELTHGGHALRIVARNNVRYAVYQHEIPYAHDGASEQWHYISDPMEAHRPAILRTIVTAVGDSLEGKA